MIGRFIFVRLAKYYDEMGRACGTHGSEEQYGVKVNGKVHHRTGH
jgi:hypothetical protein